MNIQNLLKLVVHKDASDLYLSADAPPSMRVNGRIFKIGKESLDKDDILQMVTDVIDEEYLNDFEKKPELNVAIEEPNIGRFRVNLFKQRGGMAAVIRIIKTEIPHYSKLGLPRHLTKLVMKKRGLILFVGGTGSGKSSSMASLLDYRNTHNAGHIITIEDPIEFIHEHKKGMVNQREVGVDTDSYEDALKNTLRQSPDVIMIGEIRTKETMEQALAFAETGHLCISTLHANNANQALDRIINFFPAEQRDQLLSDLSFNLRGIISQRLIPSLRGKRSLALEVLINSPRVSDLIKKGEIGEIKESMHKSSIDGMKTFDTSLFELVKANKISEEEALKNADSRNNLSLLLKNDRHVEEVDESKYGFKEPMTKEYDLTGPTLGNA